MASLSKQLLPQCNPHAEWGERPELPLCFCRDWCRAATRCMLPTSFSKINTMTCPTTPETRPCSVGATLMSLNSGSCGEQRWVQASWVTTTEKEACEVIARWKITWGVLFDPISAYPHSPWAGAQLDPSFVPSPVQWFLQLSTQNPIWCVWQSTIFFQAVPLTVVILIVIWLILCHPLHLDWWSTLMTDRLPA